VRAVVSEFIIVVESRFWPLVAALCSARYFLTNLGSTDALGNRSFVKAVTSYSDPDSYVTSL
jgi:hypothetical protein